MSDELMARVALLRGEFALDVELAAPPGITVLFGPSGAGKSTVLAMVAGLLTPDRGRIQLGSDLLFDAESRVRVPARSRRVGYVIQSLALFPHLTVLGNVTFGLWRFERNERRRRAEALLEQLGIASFADRHPGRLSGGERPFTALDHPRRRDLLSLVKAVVAERGIPTLFVTHDPEDAQAVADRVVVLEGGRVAAQGKPAEVLIQGVQAMPLQS